LRGHWDRHILHTAQHKSTLLCIMLNVPPQISKSCTLRCRTLFWTLSSTNPASKLEWFSKTFR